MADHRAVLQRVLAALHLTGVTEVVCVGALHRLGQAGRVCVGMQFSMGYLFVESPYEDCPTQRMLHSRYGLSYSV